MTAPAPHPTSAAYRQALAALHNQQRAQLQLLIQQIDASLAADWQRGPGAAAEFFQPLLDAYAKALADLRTLNDDPAATLDLSWLTSHNAQLQSIEASVRASMINYGQQAAKTVEDAQVAMLARGESDAEALLQEALNPAWELGVNPAMLWDRPNPDAIAQWLGRAGNGHPLGDLFANFDREAAAAARQALLGGLATGANPMSILTALQQALGISRSRALTISRTELLGSYRAAAHETYRANSDVLNGWLWSAGGNSPCALCMGMDGTLHSLDESLDDHPCFPAGMLVSGPRALGSTTRWYEGDLIDIVTADGRLLSVTPNHPILTPRGWIMAGLLEEGEDVVCHRVSERRHTAPVGSPNDYQVPAPIEQIASAFGRASDMLAVPMPLPAKHLHRNRRVGVDGQIDVIRPYRILRDARNGRKARRQPLTQQHLHRADAKLSLLARSGAPDLLRERLRLAALAGLSGQHDTAILLRGTFSGIDAGNGRCVSTHHTGSHKPRLNSAARDTELSSERQFGLTSHVASDDLRVRQTLLGTLRHSITHADEAIARLAISEQPTSLERLREALLTDMEPRSHDLSALPGDIGLDRILKISIRRFSGHVYNLQTSTGWYITEGIIAHNCGKCAPLPVTKPWDDILGPLGIDTSDMVETSLGAEGNYTPMSERFDDFSPERQRAIIGTQTGYEAWQRGELMLKDFIGVRPGENGFPSSYYQRSLKELQIPTRQARRLVEPSQEILEKYRLGTLRYTDFGQITPDALMPAWAKDSDASRIVYQILRNGLPYDMSSHEQGLLISNLEQMLRGELPTNVRAAAERQLQALGQSVERQTIGHAAKDLAEASLREAQATAQELTISAEHAVVERSAVTLTGDDLRAQAQELQALVRPEMSSDVATIAAQQEAKAALLRDNPDWQRFVDRLEREGIVDNYIYAGHTFTPEMQAVDYIERAWAKTPLYRDPMNIALRDVARDVFGLQVPSREVPQMLADEAAHIVEQDGAALRAYVQATYEQTQRWFEDRGISEITVFRGSTSDVAQIGLPYSGNAVNKIVEGSSLSSFTSDPEHALEFARSKTGEEYNALIAERVLVSQVFGVPDTSMARQQESEFILFGSARDAAIFSWKGADAPDLAKALDELASELAQLSVQE